MPIPPRQPSLQRYFVALCCGPRHLWIKGRIIKSDIIIMTQKGGQFPSVPIYLLKQFIEPRQITLPGDESPKDALEGALCEHVEVLRLNAVSNSIPNLLATARHSNLCCSTDEVATSSCEEL
jgi:hypothetical protein